MKQELCGNLEGMSGNVLIVLNAKGVKGLVWLNVHHRNVLVLWVVMSEFLLVGQGLCRKRVPEMEMGLSYLSLNVGFQASMENDFRKK